MKLFSILFLSTFILACYSQVVKVTDTNFDQVVKKLTNGYADWCGYCKHFDPKYKEAEKKAKSTIYDTIFFGQVNIDENPALAARFFVSRLPSVYHIKDHQVRSLSPLPRTSDQFVSFLENKEWETIQPIGYWQSPFGIFGIMVGYTGLAVKKISTISPWLAVGLLSGLFVCSFGLTFYFTRKPSTTTPIPENEPSVPANQAAGYSTSSKTSSPSKKPTI
ncbi:unnamed protein product [Cunninghamella echinulata]